MYFIFEQMTQLCLSHSKYFSLWKYENVVKNGNNEESFEYRMNADAVNTE